MTRRRTTLMAVGLFLAVLGIASGCSRFESGFGVRSREASWNDSRNGTFGIDLASVSVVALKSGKNEEASFVVWSDVMGFSGRSTSSRTSAVYESICLSEDGKGLSIRGAVSRDRPLTVQIAGNSYGLNQGAVFLVAARGNSPKVVQLDMDPGLFTNDREQLKKLAMATGPIRTFFEKEAELVPRSEEPRP